MTRTQEQRERARRVAFLAVLERDYLSFRDQELDRIALLVANLHDGPLTHSQKERARIIARELTRRAGSTTSDA